MKQTSLLLYLLFFLVSCTKIVDIENELYLLKGISVSSFFRDDDTLKVYLTKMLEKDITTYHYNEGNVVQDGYNIKPEAFVTNAHVYISDNSGNTFELQQKERYFYFYQQNFFKENEEYFLKVEYDTTEYIAKSKIPNKINIRNASASEELHSNYYTYRNIKFTIVDNPNNNDYFILKIKTLYENT